MRSRRTRIMLWLLVVLVVLLLIPVIEKHILPKRQVSTQERDYNNIEVIRNKYYLRNFLWSGIFPLYGGFISDPHFLYSLPEELTDYLKPIFHGESIRYQLIQVNPFFENKTSELILAIEIDGVSYEYNLTYPQSYPTLSTQKEPVSEFLFNENKLFFILKYGIVDRQQQVGHFL